MPIRRGRRVGVGADPGQRATSAGHSTTRGRGRDATDAPARDVTEILTSLCARLYGWRAAANRAKRAVDAIAGAAP